jgi:MFS family permease
VIRIYLVMIGRGYANSQQGAMNFTRKIHCCRTFPAHLGHVTGAMKMKSPEPNPDSSARKPAKTTPQTPAPARLPTGVYLIGVVSMCNDLATEMVTPLIPILLAGMAGGGAVALGFVEGLANAVASILRLWAGRFSDVTGGKRKPLAVTGYLISNIMRPMMALTVTWWQVVLVRSMDRVGKGLRSAPRDALIVDLSPPSLRARAFGIHSAFDNLGAVGGALMGALAVSMFAFGVKEIVLMSAIPGALAVALLAFGVREPKKHAAGGDLKMTLSWRAVPPGLREYLLTVMFFTFARTAELFVILRATELGASTAHALVLWAAFNFVKIFANYGAGILADRIGRMHLLVPGWLLYSAAMFAFCFVDSITSLWVTTIFFGFAMSVGEGVERAVLGDHADTAERGTVFGWYYALIGVASIPAGVGFGWLWQFRGPTVAYAAAAIAGLIACAILYFRVAPKLSIHKF